MSSRLRSVLDASRTRRGPSCTVSSWLSFGSTATLEPAGGLKRFSRKLFASCSFAPAGRGKDGSETARSWLASRSASAVSPADVLHYIPPHISSTSPPPSPQACGRGLVADVVAGRVTPEELRHLWGGDEKAGRRLGRSCRSSSRRRLLLALDVDADDDHRNAERAHVCVLRVDLRGVGGSLCEVRDRDVVPVVELELCRLRSEGQGRVGGGRAGGRVGGGRGQGRGRGRGTAAVRCKQERGARKRVRRVPAARALHDRPRPLGPKGNSREATLSPRGPLRGRRQSVCTCAAPCRATALVGAPGPSRGPLALRFAPRRKRERARAVRLWRVWRRDEQSVL